MDQTAQPAESASPEDRLAAFFGAEDAPNPAPEVASKVERPAVEAEDDQQETEDDAEQPEAADDGEVEEEIEGVRVRGSKEAVERLKSEREMRADYTRKTQETAAMRRAAEDRLQFAEAREQITSALINDFAAMQAKQQELASLKAQDLGTLYESSPALAMRVQQRIATLNDEVGGMERQLAQKAQGMQQAMKTHRERQWSIAAEAFKSRVGSLSQADDVAMLRQVESLGFTQDELQSKFADPRFLTLVHKAAKFDALQSSKSTAITKATKAPPVVKPGASNPGAAAERGLNDARARLKKSGRVEDAAALFMRMK